MEQFDDLNLDNIQQGKPSPQTSIFQMAFGKMTTDMRFVGLFVIISGVLNCITIIGALVGVPLIFAGLRIREAADQFHYFRMTNDPASMRNGFELQGKFFHILKILIIVAIVLMVIYIIFIIIFLSSFLGMFFSSSSSSFSS